MNPKDTPGTPSKSEVMVCANGSSDKAWTHQLKANPPIKAEVFEQPHAGHVRQLSDGFPQQSMGHSALSSWPKKRSSLSLEHELGCSDHLLTYNYPTQLQTTLPRPTHASANSSHKHGSYNLQSSEQDQSYQQPKRVHGLQSSSQIHRETERFAASGGVTLTHSSSAPSPGGSYDYFIQDLPSQQGNQPHPQQMNISQTHVQHHQRNISGNRCVPNDTLVQKSSQTNRRRITKEKLSKGDREEVWPPDVESAFMKALEVLPKLGRRKVLVNGKPCGRNELIADFIYKQTNKVRDRKQVSSHIQVLKNTRKNEVAFMKLLTDCGDGEDDIPFETVPSGCLSASHSPVPSPHLRNGRLENAPTGDASMRPSGTTVVGSIPALAQDFDNSLSLATDTESLSLGYQFSQHHYGGGTMTASRIDTNHPFNTSTQSLYQQSVTTPDSAVSLSSEIGPRDHVVFEQTNRTVFPGHPKSSAPVNWPRDTSKDTGASRTVDSFYPLWPTAFRLCMQYLRVDPIGKECLDSREHDGIARDIYDFNVGSGSAQRDCSAIGVHELARATDLRHHALGTINIHQLHPEKFPTLYDLYERATCAFLFLRVGMNLSLDLEGTFENTCLFDSSERRELRCSTQIYSFGTKVLESSEVQQATLDSGRFVHKFEFVNQFFKAFLTGIRMLATPDEVDVALSNLSLLQVYEDLDTRVEGTSPLLVMAFDFERGRGTVAPYRIVDDADVLESLESVLI